ncbi:MAG: methyltransferase type 11, partial [bacterium]
QTLEDAGFKQVEVKKVHAPLRFDKALDCLQFEQESFGALHQMLSGLPDFEQDEAWKEIELELSQFEKNGSFEGPCQMLIACGTR